jgi:hypothetical protein
LPVTERHEPFPQSAGLQLLIDSARLRDLHARSRWPHHDLEQGRTRDQGYEPHEIIGKSLELFYTPE